MEKLQYPVILALIPAAIAQAGGESMGNLPGMSGNFPG